MTTIDPAQEDRLDGWKEIADYVRRSVRTAQRWETRYGLPVRRIEATGGEVVYASRSEIDEWQRRQQHVLDTDGSASDASVDARTIVPNEVQSRLVLDSHVVYVSVQAFLFGFMVAEGLVAEMAYAFDRDGTLALRWAPIVFAWAGASLALACWLDRRMIQARRPEGLFCAAAIFAGAMAVMLIGLLPWLPSDATIKAAIQTRTIQSGYLKNTLYYFVPLVLVFVLPTFHAVVALEHEAAHRDALNVLKLIRREAGALSVRGVLLLRISHLCLVLGATALWALVTTNYLLDRIVPGPYMNLFSILVEIRVGIWFMLAVTAVAWYSARLVDLTARINGERVPTTG